MQFEYFKSSWTFDKTVLFLKREKLKISDLPVINTYNEYATSPQTGTNCNWHPADLCFGNNAEKKKQKLFNNLISIAQKQSLRSQQSVGVCMYVCVHVSFLDVCKEVSFTHTLRRNFESNRRHWFFNEFVCDRAENFFRSACSSTKSLLCMY